MKNSFRESNKGALPWGGIILTFLILIVAVVAALKFLPKAPAPEPAPVHITAKVPPAPTSSPQAIAAAVTPSAAEEKGAAASPTPAPTLSPNPKGGIETVDLKATAAETGKTAPAAELPKPAPAAPAASPKTAAVAATPQTPPAPTPAITPAPQPVVSAAPAARAPQTKPSPTQTPPKAKKAEVKPKVKNTGRNDLDKIAPFTVQVGAFRNKANADEVISQLARKGYAPFIFQVTDAQQRSFYMVRFGHFGTREEAAKALAAFTRKEKFSAVIVRSGLM